MDYIALTHAEGTTKQEAEQTNDLPSSIFAIVPDIRACGNGIVCCRESRVVPWMNVSKKDTPRGIDASIIIDSKCSSSVGCTVGMSRRQAYFGNAILRALDRDDFLCVSHGVCLVLSGCVKGKTWKE